jgi:hypothetical protein
MLRYSAFYFTSSHNRHVGVIYTKKLKVQKWGGSYWYGVHTKFHEYN